MLTKLTTHVLDTAHGKPGVGVRVQLHRNETLLADTVTNAEGRCSSPLLEGEAMLPGAFQLHFHIGDYFRGQGIASPFLDVVPIHFSIEAGQSYHIPLVCSPWSYSTYRGS
jgi:5-hydroxyisourate hydrolase